MEQMLYVNGTETIIKNGIVEGRGIGKKDYLCDTSDPFSSNGVYNNVLSVNKDLLHVHRCKNLIIRSG